MVSSQYASTQGLLKGARAPDAALEISAHYTCYLLLATCYLLLLATCHELKITLAYCGSLGLAMAYYGLLRLHLLTKAPDAELKITDFGLSKIVALAPDATMSTRR